MDRDDTEEQIAEDGAGAPHASTPGDRDPTVEAAKPSAVVAIGASAGGLSALKRLLGTMPGDMGIAIVIVMHLSPDHESLLAELLQPFAHMPVEQISGTTTLARDHIYVIPPGSNVSSVDTHLRLSELERDRRDRAPIDHFFRTLSETHDGHSVGVVLTGTGSDGALGLRRIKERGGLTIAHDPNEAEFDGMPQAAIATGMVDLVLGLDGISEAILSYLRTEPRVFEQDAESDAEARERTLQQLFALLRARTGRDFSRYKRSTLLRRTARRMQIHGLDQIDAYMHFVRRTPAEAVALADEFLVNVTEFFRDREVFAALERDVIPRLFAGKGPGDAVRAWSVGCATGEEAYSLAILLLEHAATLDAPPTVHVFASDLHDASLRRAREGVYPETIEASVSPARLRRFFVREEGGFRIRKEVREAIVFTSHNVLSDAPFSRLDLLVCRNLLIYLDRRVQGEVIELFHYALLPGGFLLLGSSETFSRDDLFTVEHKAHALYRKHGESLDRRVPTFPLAHRSPAVPAEPPRARRPNGFAEVHDALLDQVGPASLMVGGDDTVLHLSLRAGRYLRHPGGVLTDDVGRLVRAELRPALQWAVRTARGTGVAAMSEPAPFERDGERVVVTIHVRPTRDPRHAGVMLVLFEERPASARDAESTTTTVLGGAREEAATHDLERELEVTRRRLQETIEDSEASAEEMRASNEELQSMNEELRSAMEELETSKEELQSVNEELITANEENRHKVAELAQMSSDLQTLMNATEIATLFLDRDLRILRFTPRVAALFNVRHSDRGRPVADLTHRFGAHDLVQDAERVLDRLVPIERELFTTAGEWFLMRVHPYRLGDDRIAGIVITFVDITQHKDAERRVEVNTRLEELVAERTLQLERANSELEAFNYSVSHDLRAPLRGIERFSQEVLDRTARGSDGGSDGTERELLEQVVAGAKRMSELIDGLLELSKIARVDLRGEEVDLSAVAEDVVRELRARDPERQVEVTIDPTLVAFGDRRLLRVVLSNLLENAWKFTRDRRPGRIEVGGRTVDGCVECFVRDNGAGFDMRAARRLFAPFQRLHLSEEFEGTGIGLALAHRIVTRHGGTISATGERGVGATVAVTLPPLPATRAGAP